MSCPTRDLPHRRGPIRPTLRFGVIGVGQYASQYHIPNLLRRADVRLVAACDPSPERLREVHRAVGAEMFSDAEQMLDAVALDGVIISSPHTLHYRHVRAALQRGIATLVDKPFVLHVAEAIELVSTARRQGVPLMVALNRHLDPANVAARDAIGREELGHLVLIRALQLGYPSDRFYGDPILAGGGPLVGRGSHMAALLPWMTGRRPVRVTATIGWHRSSVDPGGAINVELADGVLGQIVSLIGTSAYVDHLDVFGAQGSLTVQRPAESGPWTAKHYTLEGDEVPCETPAARKTTTEHFIDVLSGSDEAEIRLIDAVYSVAIIEAAYRAARTHGAVEIMEDGRLKQEPPTCLPTESGAREWRD